MPHYEKTLAPGNYRALFFGEKMSVQRVRWSGIFVTGGEILKVCYTSHPASATLEFSGSRILRQM